MFMIHQTLGEDARIFDADEEPTPAKLFARVQTNPYDLDRESLYTRLKKLMRQWETDYPEKVKALDEMPIRIKTAKQFAPQSLVMFIRKGKLFCVSEDCVDENKQLIPLPIEEALRRIECTPDTPKLPLSENFWDTYLNLKKEAEKFSFKQSQQSNAIKASNMLSYLLEQNNKLLLPWRSFMLMLRDDIDNYGTLPEYTLRSICEWENGANPDYEKIANQLQRLSRNLGNKYLNKVKNSLKAYEQQVIVAIENQLWN